MNIINKIKESEEHNKKIYKKLDEIKLKIEKIILSESQPYKISVRKGYDSIEIAISEDLGVDLFIEKKQIEKICKILKINNFVIYNKNYELILVFK